MGINLAGYFFAVASSANLQHIHAIIHQVRSHVFEAFYFLRMAALQETDQTRRAALFEMLGGFFILERLLALGTGEVSFKEDFQDKLVYSIYFVVCAAIRTRLVLL